MDRFRTMRKKSKGLKDSNGDINTSDDAGRPSLSTFSAKSFKRSKKVKPEPAPVLDIANALPQMEDFRTSLLMPNLSARFSMLREQDDPTSKLGKAADDSVLIPRRASRFNMLDDIAEVGSIKRSFQPPFAEQRTNSYASDGGYGVEDDPTFQGSVMHRSRPGEGNTLFGGRQKVFKIPASGSASSRDLNLTSTKFLYDNDVSLSAFQTLREREKEQERERAFERQREEDEFHSRFDAHMSGTAGRIPSPPLNGYNRNRETSSSTTSAPSFGRASTAATSIVSQGGASIYGSPAPALPYGQPAGVAGIDRSSTKSRRLYEPGLDQHLHDQQSSSLTRLDLITRQQTGGSATPPPGPYSSLSQANSSNNLHERFHERGAVSISPSSRVRAASPPPSSALTSGFGNFQFGLDEAKSGGGSPRLGYQSHSPPLSPPHSESEEISLLPAAIHPTDRGKATALGAFSKPIGAFDDSKYSQRQLQLQQGRDTPPLSQRAFPTLQEETALSVHSTSVGPASSVDPNSPHNSVSTIHSRASDRNAKMVREEISTVSPPSSPGVTDACRGTFLADEVSSDDEAAMQVDPLELSKREPPSSLGDTPSECEASISPRRKNIPPPSSSSTVHTPSATIGALDKLDDPAVAQDASVDHDLSGLVRQHLRQASGASSVYDTPSSIPLTSLEDARQNHRRHSRLNQEAFMGSHEEPCSPTRTEHHKGGHGDSGTRSSTMSDASSERQGTGKQVTSPNDFLGTGTFPNVPSGPEHARGVSGETQRERQEFADELAHRRQKVLANLKGLESSDNISTPPTNRRDNTPDLLKSKTSGDSMAGNSDGAPKAMRLLGLASPDAKADGARVPKTSGDRWREEEEARMLRSIVRGPKVPPYNGPMSPRQQPHGGRHSPPELGAARSPEYMSERCGPGPMGPNRSPPRYLDAARAHKKARGGRDRDGHVPMDPSGPRMAPNESTMSPPVGPPIVRLSPPMSPPACHPITRPDYPGRASPAQTRDLSSPTRRDAPDAVSPTVACPPYSSAPRPSPPAAFVMNPTPTLSRVDVDPIGSYHPMIHPIASSTIIDYRRGSDPTATLAFAHRKRTVNKADISEPTFISCTSNIVTTSLPVGGRLANGHGEGFGSSSAPAIPPINPRRRLMGAGHAVGHLFGREWSGNKNANEGVAQRSMSEEHSSFSDEPDSGRGRWRGHRVKRSMSDGGELGLRARQHVTQSPSVRAAMADPVEGSANGSMF